MVNAADRTIHVRQDGNGDCTTISEAVLQIPKDGNMTIVVHEGLYREEVVIPRGGDGESSRVILCAAKGEKPVITGAEEISGALWELQAGSGIYRLSLEKDYFQKNAEGEYFNPFAVRWMSKGFQYKDFFTCGCVYLNDLAMTQCWSLDEVKEHELGWYADVDESTGKTEVYVNFGNYDPRNPENQIEINYRMQCITAKWNQGYITIDGFKVIRGCGPKTIDFWMTNAEAMYGAIATNGGHHWVIENCEVTQCRGVAIDFGNGSAKQELRYGGEPELYGYHILRGNHVYENATNGMMAYRGAYTEIYNNRLVNNNALNTGLLSEAYIKDVSGGWGIQIHDNYLYSDQEWNAYPIWLDSECDMCRVSRNIFYCRGDSKGFTGLDYECNSGWNLIDNNIFVGVGQKQFSSTSTYFVNNLWINIPEGFDHWPSTYNSGFVPGMEGGDGYTRAMRIVKPGTLSIIGKDTTSRWQTFNNQSKMLGNVFVGKGLTTTSEPLKEEKQASPNGGANAVTHRRKLCIEGPVKEKAVAVNGRYGEMVLNRERDKISGEFIANPDYSGGTWHAFLPGATAEEKEAAVKYRGVMAWIPATEEDLALYQKQLQGMDARETYGNECDYNGYMGNAQSLDDPDYGEARGYKAEMHSVTAGGGVCTVEATKESFRLSLHMDESLQKMEMPAVTGELLGASPCYEQAYDRYLPQEDRKKLLPEDVDIDFFGNARNQNKTSVGPFCSWKNEQYICWPKTM